MKTVHDNSIYMSPGQRLLNEYVFVFVDVQTSLVVVAEFSQLVGFGRFLRKGCNLLYMQ